AVGKVCMDAACATLVASDAEICDECGGTRLLALGSFDVMLYGWDDERPVVFALPADRGSIIGRSSSSGPTPDVDLRRFRDSGVVHRRHAWIELDSGEWQVTHLGMNPLAVIGKDAVVLEPGATARIRSGDSLQVGSVVLQFVVQPSARRI